MAQSKVRIDEAYLRIGTDYFKRIMKRDRYGLLREELKKWSKEEIKLDHGSMFLSTISKFDDFVIAPNNNGGDQIIDNCYNLYSKFQHKSKAGEWDWTKVLLEHIFGDQFELALIYLKVIYQHPKRALPILTLVSKERQTGKTTFINWMQYIFGKNMVQIDPDTIGSQFNGEYATANIVAIDETVLDKKIAVEKIKALATKKTISVNYKFISNFSVPFFGKIILASNNEDKFMRVDSEEIRFWVRKLSKPTIENHNIENDMIAEIPAFLHHLEGLAAVDFTKSRMVFTPEQLSNESLLKVKNESKSWLYHELCEVFTDYFTGEFEGDYVFARPTDIKKKFFERNSKVEIHYIRRVLKMDFELETERPSTYSSEETLINEKLNGTPFKISRELFTSQSMASPAELPF